MSFILNVVDNYVTEVAASMLFGLGYYLVKGIKKKENESKNLIRNKLEGALENWGYAKSIEEYNTLIKENYAKMDPNDILSVIVSKGYSPNIDTYNALLLNCFHSQNFECARILQDEILNPLGPITPNTYSLNILIKGLGLFYKFHNSNSNENNNTDDAIELNKKFDDDLQNLIQTFEEKNIKLDIIAMNTTLDILISQGRLQKAWTYFENMKILSTKCDYYTYTTLIKGIKKAPYNISNSDEWMTRAFCLLTEAKKTSPVGHSFYNSLLDCCVKFNQIDKAEKLYKAMLEENNNKLKEYSYSIMIKAYSKSYNLNKAIEIFNILKKVKYEEFILNMSNSNGIESIDKHDNFDDTKSRNSFITLVTTNTNIVNKDRSPYPTTITYGAMLNCCIRCNNIIKAEEIFYEMDRHSVTKNAFIYSSLINGYRKSHNYLKAINLFEMLLKCSNNLDKKNNESDKSDSLSSSSFDTYKLNKYPGENADEKNNNLNVVIFNSILDCCTACEKFEKMSEIFEYMKTSLTPPDIITYSIVIKGYSKSNRIDKVLSIYEFLSKSKDYLLDEVLYNSILDCFTRHGDENKMKSIYKDMCAKNINVSVITYGVMIKLYANLGDTFSANELFEELINKRIKPSVIIYQLLLRLYSKQKMAYKAIDVFRNMLLMKVQPDHMIYEYIINIALREGYLKEMLEFTVLSIKDGIKFEEGFYDQIVDYCIRDSQYSIEERKNMLRELYDELTAKGYYLSKYIIDKIKMFERNKENYNIQALRNNNQSQTFNYNESQYYNYNESQNYNSQSYNQNYNKNKFKINTQTNYTQNNIQDQNYEVNNNMTNYDDNQSCYSQFNLKKNLNVNKNNENNFEYEIDLNSNKEFVYPLKEENTLSSYKNNNSCYTDSSYNKNNYVQSAKYKKAKGGNYNKNMNKINHNNQEKSIYDL